MIVFPRLPNQSPHNHPLKAQNSLLPDFCSHRIKCPESVSKPLRLKNRSQSHSPSSPHDLNGFRFRCRLRGSNATESPCHTPTAFSVPLAAAGAAVPSSTSLLFLLTTVAPTPDENAPLNPIPQKRQSINQPALVVVWSKISKNAKTARASFRIKTFQFDPINQRMGTPSENKGWLCKCDDQPVCNFTRRYFP